MSSFTKTKTVLCVATFACVLAQNAAAQSLTLIGNTGYAQKCFEASNVAARIQSASFEDLQNCTKAVDHESLSRADLAATYVNRGIIYAALSRFDNAQSDYQKAMSMDDSIPAIYLNRGNLWFVTQQLDKAIEDYSKSLELDVNQPHVAFLNRGLAYEYKGNLTQARKDYQTSLGLRPEWESAKLKLARVEEKLAN